MTLKKKLLPLAKRLHLDKFMLFSVSGVIMQGINILLTFILTEHFDMHYLWSYILIFTAITITNFLLHINIIFKVKDKMGRRFFVYLGTVGLFYATNILLVKLFVDVLNLHYIYAIIAATGALYLTKFLVYDRLVFNKK